MEFDEVTALWEAAAKTDIAQGHIHPAGSVSEEEYEASGSIAAAMVEDTMLPYMLDGWGTHRILDFGCGDGRVLGHMVDISDDCWGADASVTMLNRLAERVPGAGTVLSDGIDGGLGRDQYDLIYALAVFIHHDHQSGKRMINALGKALKPGGFLALQIPCYDVACERDSWIDVTVWTQEMLEAAATSAFLQLVEVHSSPGKFSYESVGENHGKLQVFRRPPRLAG